MLVERSLIFNRHEDYDVTFSIIVEILHLSGCLKKVKEPFLNCYLEIVDFVCLDDSCRQHSLSQRSDFLHSLEAGLKV